MKYTEEDLFKRAIGIFAIKNESSARYNGMNYGTFFYLDTCDTLISKVLNIVSVDVILEQLKELVLESNFKSFIIDSHTSKPLDLYAYDKNEINIAINSAPDLSDSGWSSSIDELKECLNSNEKK